MIKTGPLNTIADVPGIMVGNASDTDLKSGVTVLTADQPFTAGVCIMGGAPGTRDVALLSPDKTVQQVDALVLSGGSAFGLDAASGGMEGLKQQGRGVQIGSARVPIVPTAILFDLLNGGNKDWSTTPYPRLGQQALLNADTNVEIGNIGAGSGATTANFKGGLGSASAILPSGHIVGALVAVNAVGSAIACDGPHFWAAPWEIGREFGGLGVATEVDETTVPPIKSAPNGNTTIAIVATNAALTQAECTRMATAAHDGIARAIVPSHTPMDGDLVFAASTGQRVPAGQDRLWLGHFGAICLARAIARAVFAARPASGDTVPSWSDSFAPD